MKNVVQTKWKKNRSAIISNRSAEERTSLRVYLLSKFEWMCEMCGWWQRNNFYKWCCQPFRLRCGLMLNDLWIRFRQHFNMIYLRLHECHRLNDWQTDKNRIKHVACVQVNITNSISKWMRTDENVSTHPHSFPRNVTRCGRCHVCQSSQTRCYIVHQSGVQKAKHLKYRTEDDFKHMEWWPTVSTKWERKHHNAHENIVGRWSWCWCCIATNELPIEMIVYILMKRMRIDHTHHR